MKRLLIVLGIGAVVLWLVGPLHGGIGELFQGVVKPTLPPPLADVQLALREAGFDPGPIDGQRGRRTRRALKAFQSAKRLKPTGEVNRETWEALRAFNRESSTKLASDAGGATEASEAFPSTSKEETRTAIMEYRLRSPDRIKKVQLALREAGFDPGPIDGELGPRTDQALRAFQKTQGLEPDGIIGMKTWTTLSEYLDPGSLRAQERAALHD